MFIHLFSRRHAALGRTTRTVFNGMRADARYYRTASPHQRWFVGELPLTKNVAASRTLATFHSFPNEKMYDRHKQLIDGNVKLTDFSVPELQEYLDYRGVSYDDCFDKESLQKKAAGAILGAYKVHRRLHEEVMEDSFKDKKEDVPKEIKQQLEDPAKLANAHFIMHLPWKTFGIPKEMIDSNKNLLLMIPQWEDDRIEAIFQTQYDGRKDPEIAQKQRALLVQELKGADIRKIAADPRTDTARAIGTAAALLYYHGDGEDFYDMDVDNVNQGMIQDIDMITTFHPVPRNWMPATDNAYGRNPESVLNAVAIMRQLVGECEAIDG